MGLVARVVGHVVRSLRGIGHGTLSENLHPLVPDLFEPVSEADGNLGLVLPWQHCFKFLVLGAWFTDALLDLLQLDLQIFIVQPDIDLLHLAEQLPFLLKDRFGD